MTLILSLPTPLYAIQVADRRLTKIATGEVVDDLANKTVLFCNTAAFSYTGIADVDGATDQWLVRILGESPTTSITDALTHLREAATERFGRISLPPSKKRHAFVGVGFVPHPSDGQLRHAIFRLSNFHGPDGRPLPEAGPEFSWIGRLMDPLGFDYAETGAPLRDEQRKWLCRRLRQLSQRTHEEPTWPWTAIRILTECIRQAAKHNSGIGRDLLAMIIPRSAAEPGPTWLLTHDGTAGVSLGFAGSTQEGEQEDFAAAARKQPVVFYDIPAARNDGILRGPAAVGPGWTPIRSIRISRSRP